METENWPFIDLPLSRKSSDARWSQIVFCSRGFEKFRLRIEVRAGDSDLCVIVIDGVARRDIVEHVWAGKGRHRRD